MTYMAVMVVAAMNHMKGEHLMKEQDIEIRPIRARIKRIARHNEDYNHHKLDEKHVNVQFAEFPRLGEIFNADFDRLGEGYWRTTPIKYLSWQDGKILFGTHNSVYEMIEGWEE